MIQNVLHSTLAAPLRWASHWSGAALRRAQAIKQPRILMYHIVGDGDLSVRQFEWQLSFLRREFDPVGLGVLVDRLQSDSITGREVAVTFDDGVCNHFAVAWPLLRKHNVPATFFVCPGLIDSGEWLWRTGLRMRLRLLSPGERCEAAISAGCHATLVEEIMQWTKGLQMNERRAFERDIEMRTPGFSPSAEQIELHAPLTWDQLRQMDENLITIGSHTDTHPMLPMLSEAALGDEIAGSRRKLEERLDRTVDLFSYPNGGNNTAVVGMARHHYRAAVTTRKDMVAGGDDPFLLPRIPAAGARAAFARRMHRPSA